MSAPDPWQHVGEPTPAFDPAALAGWGWELQLPPEQAQLLRSLELAEKAEQREREERLAERHEHALNRATAEAISRAHASGEPWDPANPWKHYPDHATRIAEAFAIQDAQIAAELRQAKRAAAKVLREHGVNALVTVDANVPQSPHPGGQSLSPGGTEPPASRSIGMASSGPEVAAPPLRRSGAVRLPGEDRYTRMRVRRFFDRVGRNHR
jgi:hypothetical protein